jgi:hypothetical protein
MSVDEQRPAESSEFDAHDHAWRRVESEQRGFVWVYQCDVCHCTWGDDTGQDEGSEADIDRRLRLAYQRERALNIREVSMEAWEARRRRRDEKVGEILERAVGRDDAAAARDWSASQRDMEAHMDAWLHDRDPINPAARQAALDDRLHSQADRCASARDRAALADDIDARAPKT